MKIKISNLWPVAVLVLLGPTHPSEASWAQSAMDEVVSEKRYHLRSSNLRRTRVLKGKKGGPSKGSSSKSKGSSSKSKGSSSTSNDDDSVAQVACLEFAARNENGTEVGAQCLCEDTPSGVVAVCIDDCLYCNDENTTCAIRSAQALFEDTGNITAIGGVYEYVSGGLDEIVAINDSNCTVDGDNNPISCEECEVYVDGELCNSCTIVDCDDGSRAEDIDCENIEVGASFNQCEDQMIDEGIFQAFSTGEFRTCVDPAILGSKSGKKGKKGKKSSGSGIQLSKALYLDFSKSSKSGKKRATSRRLKGGLE
jgi:hypothetical protein